MSDRFSQDIDLDFATPVAPWPIATDVEAVLEGAFGTLWKDLEKRYVSTTKSQIQFEADDLIALRDDVTRHGGDLRDIVIDVSYWDGSAWLLCSTYVWPRESQLVPRVHIAIRGPVRVEIEAFGLAVERMVQALRRRKRWEEATVNIRPLEVSSSAKAAAQAQRPSLIVANGMRSRGRRWLVRNRDGIIVSLGGSLVVSVGIIVVQALLPR